VFVFDGALTKFIVYFDSSVNCNMTASRRVGRVRYTGGKGSSQKQRKMYNLLS